MTVVRPDAKPEGMPAATTGAPAIAFRWERDMLGPLRAATPDLLSDAAAESFSEVPSAMGVPDLTLIVWDEQEIARRRSLKLSPVRDLLHVRVLLAASQGLTLLTELGQACGVSVAHLRRTVLPALADVGWVDRLDRHADRGRTAMVVQLHPLGALATSVVTVEAKRANWKQALHQGMRHAASADKALVAVDAARCRPALAQAEHFSRLGVGLLTVCAVTGQVSVAAPSGASLVQQPLRQVLTERCWALREAGADGVPAPSVFGRALA